MNISEDSKVNLNSVIRRVIRLIHSDLDDLNELLEKTDVFALTQKQNDVELKRERCTTLLKVLQETLATEANREFVNEGKSGTIINERSKTADKIMSLLRNRHFIESSELANYLKQTLVSEIETETSSIKTSDVTFKKKEPKSIRKIQKVYKASLKRNVI
jgi:hypothetical protein